jgi:hypothetical protein
MRRRHGTVTTYLKVAGTSVSTASLANVVVDGAGQIEQRYLAIWRPPREPRTRYRLHEGDHVRMLMVPVPYQRGCEWWQTFTIEQILLAATGTRVGRFGYLRIDPAMPRDAAPPNGAPICLVSATS